MINDKMQTENLLPSAISEEKYLLGAMLVKDGAAIPEVTAILTAEDFFRPNHQILFRSIAKLYALGEAVNTFSVAEDLRKNKQLDAVGTSFLFALPEIVTTTAYIKNAANLVKEKSKSRRLLKIAAGIQKNASAGIVPFDDMFAEINKSLNAFYDEHSAVTLARVSDFFSNGFADSVKQNQTYVERKTGFDNIDRVQFFSPGLYVIGATPAAGKTTFCWQLLEQLAKNGEKCIYCSYEMSKFELTSKTLARQLYLRNKYTSLTAAEIRRGGWSDELAEVMSNYQNSNPEHYVLELHNETVDDLLALLRPFCRNADKAPVVCLDYLQIIPLSNDTVKLNIDDAVRKLKSFQRDTNTTFVVISSFNRTNYQQQVSFESFKESGNIEYTADVVWGLQLNVVNSFKGGIDVSQTRKLIDAAKKRHPRQIQLKCLKNRQGSNYDCYFEYFAANDCFVACDEFTDDDDTDADEESRQIDEALKHAGSAQKNSRLD